MWAFRRKALDLGKYDPGVDLAQPLIVEAQPGEGARRHVLDHHVGALDQLHQQRLALVGFQIAGHAAFVQVEVQEIVGVYAGLVRTAPPAGISKLGLLHLDHVGAHPGQGLGAGGPRLELGQVDDLDTVEGGSLRRGGLGCDGAVHGRFPLNRTGNDCIGAGNWGQCQELGSDILNRTL